MQATTIEEVILYLDEIIEQNKARKNPLGYFAAMYRLVTLAVKEGIANNDFDDGPRMERLDVIFANRYLLAYTQFEEGRTPTDSWKKVFIASDEYWVLVLQHLLLGINAHINLDLAIAAVETSPGITLYELENDFNKINLLLSKLVEEVQSDLSFVLPIIKTVLKWSGEVDNYFVDFSMKKARDGAWKFATEIAEMNEEDRMLEIKLRDQKIAKLAESIAHVGPIIKLVRLFERGTVENTIELLELQN